MELETEQPAVEVDSGEGLAPSENLLEDSQAESQEIELEEIELDEDLKLSVPKDKVEKLKSYGERLKDYTQKTQALAEERRQIQEQQKLVEVREQIRQQNWREATQIQAIDDRLQQLQGVTHEQWQQLIQTDAQRAQQLQLELVTLQSRRGQLANSIGQRQQLLEQQQSRSYQEAVARGTQELERDIKGWGPDLKAKLLDYSKTIGLSPEALSQALMQPAFVKLLHKQYQADQSAKLAQKTPAKPVTRVDGGSSTSRKPLSEVTSPEEWARRRREWKSKNR